MFSTNQTFFSPSDNPDVIDLTASPVATIKKKQTITCCTNRTEMRKHTIKSPNLPEVFHELENTFLS